MTYYESLNQKLLRNFVEERIVRYYKSFTHTDSLSRISPEHIIYFTLLDTYERLSPVHDAFTELSGLNLSIRKEYLTKTGRIMYNKQSGVLLR